MSVRQGLEVRSSSVHQFRKAVSQIYLYERTGEFIDHWFRMPKTGLIPNKASISPRAMQSLLPDIIILEKKNPLDGYRIRLMGTAVASRWGFDATRENYLDFTCPQNGEALQKIFHTVQNLPCGVILRGDDLYTSGRLVSCEMALFPVRTGEPGGEGLFGLITGGSNEFAYDSMDILAMGFYAFTATHFLNIGAGIPD